MNNSITILITNGERLIGNERETQDRITRAKARNMCICNKNPTLTSEILVEKWQGHKDLNPEPTVLETAALPIELYPYIWWAFGDSNPGPTGYEPAALTN